MKKSMKKVLSYALGIILALGVGFSYAYAVGANDSNAFVTKTEWNTKVAQIEASLDNVSKTIKSNNMDFMMNAPRLQVNLVEGFENIGGVGNTGNVFVFTAGSVWNHYQTKWSAQNKYVLVDTLDGGQNLSPYGYYGADMNGNEFNRKAICALKSNDDPNIYLLYQYFLVDSSGVALAQVTYVDISKTTQNYSSARTLTVTLPKSDWIKMSNSGAGITDQSRVSTNIYTGTEGNGMSSRLPYSGNNSATYGNLSNPGTGYVRLVTAADSFTVTYEFPATTCTIRTSGAASTSGKCFDFIPRDFNGRKYGTTFDDIDLSGNICKLYSPQKGCLALKTRTNGEIPIFNE